MNRKKIGLIVLVVLISWGVTNLVHADSGPTIGANEAKIIAQKYLNKHGLHYKAITPRTYDDCKVKVKDMRTGKIKWIPFDQYKYDWYFTPDGKSREEIDNVDETYKEVKGVPSVWFVKVKNSHGRVVGTIYINDESGEVFKGLSGVKSADKNTMKVSDEESMVKNTSLNDNWSVSSSDNDFTSSSDDDSYDHFLIAEVLGLLVLCLGCVLGVYLYFKRT